MTETSGRMWAQLESRIRDAEIRLVKKELEEAKKKQDKFALYIVALASITVIMVNTIWLLDYLSKN